MSDRRILVIGLPFFGARVAKSLRGAGYRARYASNPGRDLTRWPGLARDIIRADAIYAIGSSVRRNAPLDLLARAGKATLVHWVGTDVLVALEDWRAGRASSRVLERGVHCADAPWLIDELRPLGITVEERLLPVPVLAGSVQPLPSTFRVLIFLRRTPHSAYDVESTLEVIRRMPEVQFAIVGGYVPPEPFANIEVLGLRTDMRPVYQDCVVLLRLMRHDAMSHSVIEAASFGRYVLWSYAIDGVQKVDGADAAIAAIADLQRRFTSGELPPNTDAARQMQAKYSYERSLEQIRGDLDRLLA